MIFWQEITTHLGIHHIVQLDAKLKIQSLQNKNKLRNENNIFNEGLIDTCSDASMQIN